MSVLLLILLSGVLISYFAIAEVGALRPFSGDDPFDSATGVAVVTLIDLAILSPVSYVVDRMVLRPLQIDYLAPVAFVVLILLAARINETVLRRVGRWLPHYPGFFVLMMAQGTLLGVLLLGRLRSQSVMQALLFGIGAGIGFALLLLAFCSLQQRQQAASLPAVFRQAPVALITVGIMALALMGLTGLVQE
jgi:electron transport complex protein RnfA